MNPEVKAAWVAALRSGEFQQGKHTLVSRLDVGAKYCCLGVLCELAVRAGVATKNNRLTSNDVNYGVKGDWESVQLPQVVQAWAGLDSADPTVEHNERSISGIAVTRLSTLSGLNDTRGYTFAQIADVIEEHL